MNASVLNISGAINQGRRSAFATYGNDIYALQRSEILDEVTCNYCMSIDSRIFRKNDSFTKTDSIHSNCRGLWVEILSEETDKPPITGMPQSLRDSFDAVNSFSPPKHPIVKKNMPAAEFLKQQSERMTEKLSEKIAEEEVSEKMVELKKSVDELKKITANEI